MGPIERKWSNDIANFITFRWTFWNFNLFPMVWKIFSLPSKIFIGNILHQISFEVEMSLFSARQITYLIPGWSQIQFKYLNILWWWNNVFKGSIVMKGKLMKNTGNVTIKMIGLNFTNMDILPSSVVLMKNFIKRSFLRVQRLCTQGMMIDDDLKEDNSWSEISHFYFASNNPLVISQF